jgi:hypothetical protein
MGIVVYPSMHFVLWQARGTAASAQAPADASPSRRKFVICSRKDRQDDDLYRILEMKSVDPGACLAVVGPAGTHKLALAMNLATGQAEKSRGPRVLIVSFGGDGIIDFPGIAWVRNRHQCRQLKLAIGQPRQGRPMAGIGMPSKFWTTTYRLRGQDAVTVLTFRIGELAPEECFSVVESELAGPDAGSAAQRAQRRYDSVLLCDTAQLCTGFPLLREDRVFFPALLDLFEAHGLVTVCIGVEDERTKLNQDVNFALQAKANYRMVLSHSPVVADLARETAEQVLRRRAQNKPLKEPVLREQLVSLVIDNVTGKHYGREPRWLWAEEPEAPKSGKTLHCESFLSPSAEFLKKMFVLPATEDPRSRRPGSRAARSPLSGRSSG